MRARVIRWWQITQESLWFIPGILTIAGALLAVGMVQLDHELALDQRGGRIWAFSGGAAGARGVLQAIAGSLITVTATVFSITIVTLQLASTQFTPRVLRTFTRDRGVQLVFGVFIGTFTYSLLVLRAIRSEADDYQRFVPSISVIVAIGLALVCVGFLIFVIHHIAQMIRVPAVVERVVADGERLIAQRYPSGIGNPVPDAELIEPDATLAPVVVTAETDGYLVAIAEDDLFGIESDGPLSIAIEPGIGGFVLYGEPLATVWPGARCTDEVVRIVRRSCVLGSERTLGADIELPVRQLADIAVKALSPGINDPTTAAICIDRLGQVLLMVARRGEPPAGYRRKDSAVTLRVPAPSFAALVESAFTQIRHFGMNDPLVRIHLLDMLDRMTELVPPAHRPAIIREAALVRDAIRKTAADDDGRVNRTAPAALSDDRGTNAARPGAAGHTDAKEPHVLR